MKKLGVLVIFVAVLLISNLVFASANYEIIEELTNNQETFYLDTNSITFEPKNPNIIYYIMKAEKKTGVVDNYFLLKSAFNVENRNNRFLVMGKYNLNDQLVSSEIVKSSWAPTSPQTIPFFDKIVRIANANSQVRQVSQPVRSSQLIYNGPLTGQGWKMEMPKTGVNTDIKKVVISNITTGSFNYDGDAWIQIDTNASRPIEINVKSALHGDNQYNAYRTYQLELSYKEHEAKYTLPTKQGIINGDLTKVPGQIEITLDGNKIVANLIINGAIACHIEAADSEVTALSGMVSSMGAEGNMQLYK